MGHFAVRLWLFTGHAAGSSRAAERLVLEWGGFGGEGDRGARGLRRGDGVERHPREMAREVAEAGDGQAVIAVTAARLRLVVAETSTAVMADARSFSA